MSTGRIPMHVLTGFLGSGKTTLLNRVLRDPAWADSAVLINEIGAVSIDHYLVDRIESGDNLDIVVLKGGCTCCVLRGDMVAALRELYRRRADGLVPPFARVVMETTGLADPAPVLFTLVADPALRHKFERGVVIVTLDAVHGLAQLPRYPEARKQIAVADRIVLTKTDRDGARSNAQLHAAIRRFNPAVAILDARAATTPAELLENAGAMFLVPDSAYGSHKPEYSQQGAYGFDKINYASLHSVQGSPYVRRDDAHDVVAEKLGDNRPHLEQSPAIASVTDAEHTPHIASVAIVLDRPLEWAPFSVWLTLLLHAHGEKMLRFKALLDVAGWPGPVALDGIHHMIDPPRHLGSWSAGPHVSRLVFIAQGLEMKRIEPSLRAFLAGEYTAREMSGAR